mgnify:CR=1 FL=1
MVGATAFLIFSVVSVPAWLSFFSAAAWVPEGTFQAEKDGKGKGPGKKSPSPAR